MGHHVYAEDFACIAVGLGDGGVRELGALRAEWRDYVACHFMLGEGPHRLDSRARPGIVFCFFDGSSASACRELARLEQAARKAGSIFVSIAFGDAHPCVAEGWRTLRPRFAPSTRPGDVARALLSPYAAGLVGVDYDELLGVYHDATVGLVFVARAELDVAPNLLRQAAFDATPLKPRAVSIAGGQGCEWAMRVVCRMSQRSSRPRVGRCLRRV